MSNDKAQMSNQGQNSKDKKNQFCHLSIWISTVIWILIFEFVWRLDFGIWNLANRIATPDKSGLE
jgi:hypothetical protein